MGRAEPQATLSARTAKLAAQSKLMEVERAHSDDDVSDAEPSENEENGDSSDGSDYSGGGKKRGAKPPPAKRGRVSTTKRASPLKKTPRGKKSLHLLPTMPMDILFEIFKLLHPKDIVSLSRTNKAFRETLLSRNAITVWKEAIKTTGAPGCPDDMTEPKWAALIFGNSCQNCNAKNIQKVDFFLRRRVCTVCKKKNLVAERNFGNKYPDTDRSVMDLIPCTNVGGWAHGHASGTRFFWSSDIDDMVQILAEYQHDIHMRRANAQKKLDEFIAERKTFVDNIISNVGQYQAYLDNVLNQRAAEGNESMGKRQLAIRERFKELGYASEDVSACLHHSDCSQKTALSERIWARIRPTLEALVLQSKNRRLERELAPLKASRRKVVHDLYTEYQRTLVPSQWLYLPRTIEICQFSPFLSVIDLPRDVEVTATDFKGPMEALPELLSRYSDATRQSRRKLIPPQADAETSSTGGPTPDPLELATSVFRCRQSGYQMNTIVIGMEAHMTHNCTSPERGLPTPYQYPENPIVDCLSYNTSGSDLVRLLVRLLGLDPSTTSASEMDRSGIRFECSSCPSRNVNGVGMRFGFSWRGAIVHILSTHRFYNDSPPTWSILSDPDAKLMRQQEDVIGNRYLTPSWTCNHCPGHLNNFQKFAVVVGHLRDVHKISEPKQPDDLFFYERVHSGPDRVRFTTGPHPKHNTTSKITDPQSQFLCIHCANGSPSAASRLFKKEGVLAHIQAKHQVKSANATEDVDFKKGP